MKNFYLVYEGEFDFIIKGIFSDLKTFIVNYITVTEARKGEGNKCIKHELKNDEIHIYFESNMGKFEEIFYYQYLETNKVY